MLAADIRLAGADVDDVGIGRRYGDGSDGADGDALVGDRKPGAAAVFCLPDAAADRTEIEGVGLIRVSCDGYGAAAAHGAHVAPFQAGEEIGRKLLRCCRKACEREEREQTETTKPTEHGAAPA